MAPGTLAWAPCVDPAAPPRCRCALTPGNGPGVGLPGRDSVGVPTMLLRQVHPHSRNMASRHGASVVAAAPPQKRRTGVVDAACGLRLRVANERRECPIRPATQEQVDGVG